MPTKNQQLKRMGFVFLALAILSLLSGLFHILPSTPPDFAAGTAFAVILAAMSAFCFRALKKHPM